MKVLAQLVPRELSVEHSGSIIGKLSDEQLAAMIAELDRKIADRLAGKDAKLINVEPPPERGAGTLGWRKCNPKTPPHQLAKARERARRLLKSAKPSERQSRRKLVTVQKTTDLCPVLAKSH